MEKDLKTEEKTQERIENDLLSLVQEFKQRAKNINTGEPISLALHLVSFNVSTFYGLTLCS